MDRVGQPGPFYYHQNTLWSVFALTNPTGKGVEGYSYDAYGYQTVILPGADGMLWTADDDVLSAPKALTGTRSCSPASATILRLVSCITRIVTIPPSSVGS